MQAELKKIYRILKKQQGARNWWPAETKFEILVGAVLTQNTAWTNVEKAIHALKEGNLLSPQKIVACKPQRLANCIRSSGYFNVKAKRLRALCEWYVKHGEYKQIKKWPTDKLRQELLAVHGVGPETADDIVLYAFKRPVFVIDAYTKRIFSRLGLTQADQDYESMRSFFEKNLEADVQLFGEFHAHIVEHGKNICRVKPRCEECALNNLCAHAH